MSLEPARDRRPPRRTSPTGALVMALIVGAVVGGIVGYVARGGGGTTTVTVAADTRTAPDPAATAQAEADRLRSATRVVVLNGTQINGLAGRVSDQVRTLGWRRVEPGNGPSVTRTEIYALPAGRAAADLMAEDLDALAPQDLPAGSPLRRQFPRAQVYVVLGPEADAPPPVDTAPADTGGTVPDEGVDTFGTAPDTIDTIDTGPQAPPPEDDFSTTP